MECTSNQKERKGLWSPEEDERLRHCILQHGHVRWSSVPSKAGLQRNGKSCRLRWINYLRPGLKRGTFSLEEHRTILGAQSLLGNKWSQIAQHLPGRTDNEIKNYWHSCVKKKMITAKSIEPSVVKTETLRSNSASFESASDTDKICILPRVIFAEWLSLDHVNSTEHNVFNDVLEHSFNFGDASYERALINDGSFGKEGLNEMSKTGFENDDQVFSSSLWG